MRQTTGRRGLEIKPDLHSLSCRFHSMAYSMVYSMAYSMLRGGIQHVERHCHNITPPSVIYQGCYITQVLYSRFAILHLPVLYTT